MMTFWDKYIKSFLVSCLLLAANFTLYAQDSIPDYNYLTTTNVWLSSENAAGLNEFKGGKLSVATASINKGDGQLINYYESDNYYQYAILSESYYKLNSKVTVYGKIDYSYFSGKDMNGSCFIDPYYNAFNIVEYSDDTAGEKVKESYLIEGGFSTKLNNKLVLGAKADYKNVSYFKTKDLRHTNDLMDLKLYTGAEYKLANLDLGINYYYHRSVESIIFKIYGNTDQQYYCLIDYGGFFGYVESFDSSSTGFTRGSSKKPYFNQEHGLSVQLNLFSRNRLSFFNEFSVKIGDGYYGKKSTSSIVYTEHTSNTYTYNGAITLKNETSSHQLKLYANYCKIDNTLNDPESSTDSESGTSIITYGIAHKIAHKTKSSIRLNYAGNFQIENGKPLWNLNASFAFNSNYSKSIYYEVLSYRRQQINQLAGEISGYKNFYSNKKSFRIIGGLAFSTGSGYAFKDTNYTSNESDDDAVTMDVYAYSEFEFLTADRIKGNLGFRYSHSISNDTNKIYGEVNYSATKAFSTKYVGDYFGSASIVLGYQF